MSEHDSREGAEAVLTMMQLLRSTHPSDDVLTVMEDIEREARDYLDVNPPPEPPAADRDAAGVEALTLDRGALSAADLAYCEATGPSSNRVAMAIRAYLWALENTTPHPLGTAYPSLNQWRDEAARITRDGGPLLAPGDHTRESEDQG